MNVEQFLVSSNAVWLFATEKSARLLVEDANAVQFLEMFNVASSTEKIVV